jgi:tRNA(fMet)-specific endonuclease VapC
VVYGTRLGNQRKRELEHHMARYAVLPATRKPCAKWANVSYSARRKGRPIQTADAWIAASALYYDVPLITNNGADYSMLDDLTILTAP